VHALTHDMAANYAQLLDKVLSQPADRGFDLKDRVRFRRVLRDEDAFRILSVIWKESNYVSHEDLEAVDLGRSMEPDNLTTFGLAVKLASSPRELSKLNSRIRQIAIAANAFGLIERHRASTTNVQLRATEALHNFMMRLAEENGRLLERFKRTISKQPQL
jgi:hypothetical protein